ncbi:LADA_0E01948g1_1 [Lachancea dasiensis]|uniref:LADA_0E01948g1_1 n=1 Tax=Lachancea dasiensis TaxID=1072105 RepID=A0A1G4JAQ4_9SACH|nr:LADA_0E01948g1_1 [Lachancea dasiensis]
MGNFFEELWNSIFTPGTSPQLIVATHVSFVLLSCCLGWLIYCTRNLHFVALLTISTLLWITVTWFVNELHYAKLRDNEELAKTQGEKADDQQQASKKSTLKDTATTSATKPVAATRSRKV